MPAGAGMPPVAGVALRPPLAFIIAPLPLLMLIGAGMVTGPGLLGALMPALGALLAGWVAILPALVFVAGAVAPMPLVADVTAPD